MTETLNLTKGEKIDLTKGNASLAVLALALGWDINSGNSGSFDLDAFAILLNEQGKIAGPTLEDSVCFFRNKSVKGLELDGDNTTGAGDGDDETIRMTLASVPAEVHSIIMCVNIYQAADKGQNFGMVRSSYVRAYDSNTNAELCKFDLQEDYGRNTGVYTARVYRHGGEWKFEAIGEGFNGDINDAVAKYK